MDEVKQLPPKTTFDISYILPEFSVYIEKFKNDTSLSLFDF